MTASGQNMNCEDYRELLAADPTASVDGGTEHVAACASCAAFTAEMRAFNDKISAALAISVPDLEIPELPEIEDDNVVDLPFGGKKSISAPFWIGIAATVVLAAFVGIRMINTSQLNSLPLADQVLAHLDHEPQSLRVTDVAVSDEQFAKVVNPKIGTMDRSVGLVSYAQSCVINGKTIPHLVIQGQKGPITLLLMPEEMVDGATTLDGKGVNGVILPVGNGSIAIIGERDEPLTEVEQKIINSVEWSI